MPREYLLVGVDFEKFYSREVEPDAFEAALRKTIGEDATLEEVDLCVGDGNPHDKPFDYLVTTDDQGLRPKLKGVHGVRAVLVFSTRPITEQTEG